MVLISIFLMVSEVEHLFMSAMYSVQRKKFSIFVVENYGNIDECIVRLQ